MSTHAEVLRDPGPVVQLLLGHTLTRAVRWGQPWQYGTSAYWVARASSLTRQAGDADARYRLTGSFREEVALCMLGGWGMPFEVGLAAFNSVKDAGLLDETVSPAPEDLLQVLSQPLATTVGLRRYRFPQQRSERLSAALSFVGTAEPEGDHLAIRDWLVRAPGIGLKTASWVVRNYFGADCVAILDIHLVRAGVQAGVFSPNASASREYSALEALFLAWARAGRVSAADLDTVIWRELAASSRSAS